MGQFSFGDVGHFTIGANTGEEPPHNVDRRVVNCPIDMEEIKHRPYKILNIYACLWRKGRIPKIIYIGSDGIDAEGLSRDFISRLFDSIHKKYCDEKSCEEPILPRHQKDNDELMEIHQAIGTIFGIAFLGYREITIGNHFNPVLFEMIHALTKEDILQVSCDTIDNLSQEVIDQLLSIYLRSLGAEEEHIEGILQNAFEKVLEEGETLEDIYGVESKEEFIKNYFSHILIGTIRVAKGMHEFIGDQNWEKIAQNSSEHLQNCIEGSFSISRVRQALVWDCEEGSQVKKYLDRWFQESEDKDEIDKVKDFLFCLTGAYTLPLRKRLQVHVYEEKEKLPTWHTCLSSVDLPNGYPNYDVFKQKLEMSILEGKVGFQSA